MKYRIKKVIEIKPNGSRSEFYYPQYRFFFMWRNFSYMDSPYTYSYIARCTYDEAVKWLDDHVEKKHKPEVIEEVFPYV